MDGASTPGFGLRIVIALPCEARPVIQRFGLKPATGEHPFRIYHDQERVRWLIESGVGRQAAGVATAYLAGLSTAGKAVAWLNAGVAGHATLPVGQARAAHKITDAASGIAYYPPVILQELKTEPLVTVTEPEELIAAKMLVDMEGSAFYAAASTFASTELVHCLKIVSDHGAVPGRRLAKESVRILMENRLPLIEMAAEQLLGLSNELATRWASPASFDVIAGEFHFTSTQRNQLRRLLRRWQVLLEEEDVIDYVEKHAATGREALACLDDRLKHPSLVISQQ